MKKTVQKFGVILVMVLLFMGFYKGIDIKADASVATYNGNQYADLASAFEAVIENGETEAEKTVTLTADVELSDNLIISENQIIILNLNDHCIDMNGKYLTNNGNLTVTDKENGTERGWEYLNKFEIYDEYPQYHIKGGTIANGGEKSIRNYGTFTFIKGTFFGCANPVIINYEDAEFTMTNGTINYCGIYENNENCAAVHNLGNFTMNGGIIEYNENLSGNGGGVANYGKFVMNDGNISHNKAGHSGGGVISYKDSEFILAGGVIDYNEASNDNVSAFGGGVAAYGKMTFSGGTVSYNNSDYGAGISLNGELTMSGGSVEYNGSTDQNGICGGGIHVGSDGTFKLTGGTVLYNGASTGAGIYNTGKFTLDGGTIQGNGNQYGAAGGVYNTGTFEMKSGNIYGNWMFGKGAGVYNTGSFTLTGGKIDSNSAESDNGGGVYNCATFEMKGGTISNNNCGNTDFGICSNGGGVYNTGTFTLKDGTIEKNNASESGGGIYNEGTFTMEKGTVSSNTASLSAAGIYNSGTFNMKDGSVSSNITENSAGATNGGGIYNAGNATFSGGSVSLNKANYGAGVYSCGTFEMTGGFIEKNSTFETLNAGGGGVYIGYDQSSEFVLKNGEIRDNTSFIGAGLYVDGTFKMNGGKITGNIASGDNSAIYNLGNLYLYSGMITGNKKAANSNISDSGAIWSLDSQYIELGGDIVIKENLNSSGEECNLYIHNYYGDFVTISNTTPLKEGADIHVTLEDNSKSFVVFLNNSDKQYLKSDDTTMGVYTVQYDDVYDGYLWKYVHVYYYDRYENYTDNNLYLPGDTVELKGEMYKVYDDLYFAGWDVIYHDSLSTCEGMMTYTIDPDNLKALGCDDMVTFYPIYMPKISDINGKTVDGDSKFSFTIKKAEDVVYHIGALDYNCLNYCDPSLAVEVYLDKDGNGNYEEEEKLTYGSDFTVTEGSVVVTVSKDVLNALPLGNHNIHITVTYMSLDTYTFDSVVKVKKPANKLTAPGYTDYKVVNTGTK